MNIHSTLYEDIVQIADIEAEFSSPWSQGLIGEELHLQNGIHLSAKNEDGNITGWCCARVLSPEAELLKITVSRSFHRQGIGTALLRNLIHLLQESHCDRLFLEVRQKNLTANQFYLQCGFIQTALRENYYPQPPDNAVVMMLPFDRIAENSLLGRTV